MRTIVCTILLLATLPAFAATVETISDFETGAQGWGQPLNNCGGFTIDCSSVITNGGPGGAGDDYLQVIADATGATASTRSAAINTSAAWIGNYTTAGITAIRMNIRVFSGAALEMRVQLNSSVGAVATTVSQSVPANGLWNNVAFSLAPADLTVVTGADTVANNLANVISTLIRHQSGAPAGQGAGVTYTGTVGWDNIRSTTTVPVELQQFEITDIEPIQSIQTAESPEVETSPAP